MLRRFCTLEALAVLLPGLCWRCAPDAPATRAVDAAPGAAGNNAEPAALPGEPAAQPGVSETPAQAAEGPAAPSLALPGAMAGVLDAGPLRMQVRLPGRATAVMWECSIRRNRRAACS
jgi:hypothetical protein